MTNPTIGNVNPDPNQRAVDDAAAIVAGYGYGAVRVDPIVAPLGTMFRASTVKTIGRNSYMAQAEGRSPRSAAEQLVRVITRR